MVRWIFLLVVVWIAGGGHYQLEGSIAGVVARNLRIKFGRDSSTGARAPHRCPRELAAFFIELMAFVQVFKS